MKKQKNIIDMILIINVLLIVIVLFYGIRNAGKNTGSHQQKPPAAPEKEVYYLGGHDLVEFSEVMIEQFRKESKLIVSSVEASVTAEVKQTGVFELNMLSKTQKVYYRGTGRFYVDLSKMGKHSIRLDNDNAVVTITIPHTELAEIEIDPEKFSFGEVKNGLLAFGDLKFTAAEYNRLETECKNRIKSAVDVEENRKAADVNAIAEMRKIYEPIVKAVDDTYRLEVVFADDE